MNKDFVNKPVWYFPSLPLESIFSFQFRFTQFKLIIEVLEQIH